MTVLPINAPLRDGLRKGARQYWKILKIVLPVFLTITALRLIPFEGEPLIPRLAAFARPAMGCMGLPGEAALAILLGWSLNIYACVSAMATGGYSPAQATAMGLIVGIAHNFFVETAILYKLKAQGFRLLLFRIAAGLLSGAIYLRVAGAGTAAAADPHPAAIPPGWLDHAGAPLWRVINERLLPLPAAWIGGGLKLLISMAVIIALVFIAVEFLRAWGGLEWLLRAARPLLRLLGLSDAAAMPWLAAFLFGIVYGAGLMLQAAEERPLPPDQILKVSVFALLCHAIIEDTWLFQPVGGSVWQLILIRLALAIGVGALLARFVPRSAAV